LVGLRRLNLSPLISIHAYPTVPGRTSHNAGFEEIVRHYRRPLDRLAAAIAPRAEAKPEAARSPARDGGEEEAAAV
jgi:hypothetical protein